MNGPGWAFQPAAPSIGLQARPSPSFFSSIRGVTPPMIIASLDAAGGALLATPPNTAQMATAVSAVLMELLLRSGPVPPGVRCMPARSLNHNDFPVYTHERCL